jgi:20S proteasome subunit alpha 2
LVAGYDEEGPHLTQIDPSGAYYNWRATAVGKNAKSAKVFLEKRFKVDMEIEDAIHTALMTLKEGFEGTCLNN